MLDRKLMLEDFLDKVASPFQITFDDGPPIDLTLIEAQLLEQRSQAGVDRPPFSLVFVSPGDLILPQRMYRIEHGSLGQMEIFLVPIGKDGRGVSYQAVFN